MKKIGIVGSRDFPESSKKYIKWFIEDCARNTIIISGGARGVDRWAVQYAKDYDMETIVFLLDKSLGFPKALFARNIQIVDESDLIVAFWDGESSGTKHSIKNALKKGKFVIWIDERNEWNLLTDLSQLDS